MREARVSGTEAGERLDVFVARVAEVSRAVAARLVASGDVTVDGSPAGKSLRVEEGMIVAIDLPESEEGVLLSEDIDVRTVYEDQWLMVVSKPAGLVVHPAPGHTGGTLVNALLERGAAGGSPERPGIVHRLDAGTSGLMIVAKDEQAFEKLSEAMSAREVSRTYLALCEGVPVSDQMTIDAPIGRSTKHRKKMAVVAGGKPSITRAEVLERHERTAMLELKPQTGRTHQIRVHLAAAGHPVVGDPVYGRDRALARELGLDRPFLHAARLAFTHPMTSEPLELEDPLPPVLVEVLARARALTS